MIINLGFKNNDFIFIDNSTYLQHVFNSSIYYPLQRNIKRAMIEEGFDDPELGKIIMKRFMELAKVKFK